MIRIFTLLLGFSSVVYGQIQTTTGPGNFYNPLLWDCFCVPADGDTLVINHAMTMSAPIYYTSGQITINPAGSLLEDGSDRDIWVDGGSLINNGLLNCHRFYISNNGTFENSGYAGTIDSIWNQATIINTGDMIVYDFLNDEDGIFEHSGLNLTITNNFNNQGYFLNDGGMMEVDNDFSNCNVQTLDAVFENNGWFCINNDFTNCVDDTLTGSGVYYIAGSSSNLGVFEGNFTFNTPTGALGFNSGSVDSNVDFGNAPCGLGIAEDENRFSVYPNPAKDLLYVSESNLQYQITDMSGKVIANGTTNTSGIDLSSFSNGFYTIRLADLNGNISIEKFVKQ